MIHVENTKDVLIEKFNLQIKKYIINRIEQGISISQLAIIFQIPIRTTIRINEARSTV